MAQYHDLFANDPERRHFAEYLTGLFIAERKTVGGCRVSSCRTGLYLNKSHKGVAPALDGVGHASYPLHPGECLREVWS